ncbi:protein ALP1-like [Monomorium pharaonis]|uniref:protein ALP1-like n=2 Tax=Monomorium pharaonis TaxID=307658 RepID=UPI00174761DE|nr:protein ALP1-like [Monomorium pharaonis]XP_036143030.1 protein ALP1-like [Monomorium pharaonis]XP_036143031.1 protein ALP1-like [Monomorium pharaonis]XP_036143032.1 protein ALP1-like [Monomorium pharaonis]XP_036144465.1 protein ALP1-like [Monomorium pharaonis]XP_036146302.1 protein ALP1-like [Monomorium pharaonis]XP_036147000.1 protein ALP1-like [Monomorium pharaonis]
MSFINKYQVWLQECNQKLLKREQIKRKALIALLINEVQKKKKRNYSKKRYWVEPIFQERKLHGFYHAIFPVITLEDSRFRNYFRMSVTQYEELLCIIAPSLTKQTVIREPIPPAERLSMTLRFLASGDSMTSISYQYLVGLTTVSNIIEETCSAIWNCLVKEVLPSCLKEEDWLDIANEFEHKWNFNHCIGAIDGKHVLIQCPNNAGSSYFNYKHTHSIVLLGICNANYCFTFVDIGAYGRRSDGGIFKDSLIGQKFHNMEMNLPQPRPLTSNGESLPYVLVGDEAFQLTNYLLRPYPGKNLNEERTIYNYRLSRARRTIENTFGIIVSRWRILKRPIICTVEKSMKIIQAIVCLHNWIRKQDTDENQYVTPTIIDREDSDGFIPGSWREEINNSALENITRTGSNNCSRHAMEIREQFCEYFNNEGALTWQYNMC